MAEETAQTFYLKDYTPFGFDVENVALTFRLAPSATRVLSKIHFAPKPDAADQRFFLHGEQLKLISAKIDGVEITPELSDAGLSCTVPNKPFVWEAEVEIDPAGNTALEGLYMSNGMYCTQCEAEGFRKITYYPDRPDVMSTFSVRIEGDEEVLLSNGNPKSQGEGWAEWHDPWPKPAYLFALVAGDLVNYPDKFTTQSGKEVELNIWVRPGDEGKCFFGMEALKQSMKWDEDVYGLEYDLDIFNIVAVDDFNMGAMENKGLNIFNSSCVLASPETSTDANFERIEAIIAHEYFHNWTGNRITCRDWFQLCLKEGLTVFRDAQFTSDMRSEPVKRIEDVIALRARQFSEDMGPLSHPVRPEEFQEINNFYTATVYEKGAEVIGMLKRLVGDADYYKALKLYFERHDGQACTIEDWLKVFEDTTDRDLSQFKRWYSQAGTPRLTMDEAYADGTYTLTFSQKTAPTPGQDQKDPRVIPIAVGLLNDNGDELLPTQVLEMTEAKQSFSFDGLSGRPTASVLREFSAPVILERESSKAERAFLLAHDTDPFNRWEAGNSLAREARIAMVTEGSAPDPAYLDALQKLLRDDSQDPAFRALVLQPPSQSDIAQALFEQGITPDPQRIYDAAETFAQTLAEQLTDSLPRLYADTTLEYGYRPDADSCGKRALNFRILSLLSRLDGGEQASRQYYAADNMTQQSAALTCLLSIDKGEKQSKAFFTQWKEDRLVMDKWFALQVACAAPDKAAGVAKDLTRHELFTLKNPNRFRAVMGALSGNHAGFHHESGAGYRLLADNLIALDRLNPQTTARMCTAFQSLKRYDAARQNQIRQELQRIAAQEGLSRDTNEMISRILEA
ncbi:aminopeptidase N [Roseobacter sp. SK209-2-6]|uniref:aminopeptidase N n=1 Tax=Roseobacter sp. SK209-2-6 TaxID=388739 RepID=UPI0000F3CFBC|nr:aminopeptidase N [Roseobacter sp. SK209-2-6]EBA15179.1 aminopeptidase N [Roseobacter sp. SK209-2-6]